jgi:hypothetical protein
VAGSGPVKHTFGKVAAGSSLEVFVKHAIEGVGDEGQFYKVVEARGAEASQELLRYLTELPAKANCDGAEQFVRGYVSHSGASDKDVEAWEGMLREAFALATLDLATDRGFLKFGESVIALIRKVGEFASPRLRAWGV